MTEHALLLVNLGSPASPQVADVRSYLNEFLMDPYVIDLPWPIRRLLVSLILWRRPEQSAHAYASIWWEEGSPLLVLSRRLQEKVRPHWPHGPVELAMRYGQPSIEQVLQRLSDQGIRQVTFAPLYPQFADSTITTAIVEAQRVLQSRRLPLQLKVLPPFYAEPDYRQALLESLQPYLAQPYDHLLMSFHGLPESHIRKLVKDPKHSLTISNSQEVSEAALRYCYRSQCLRTAENLAADAGLVDGSWSVSFQSRLGRNKWIEPYTETLLQQLGKQGVQRLLVICPAFVSDCLETLEEIAERGSEEFRAAGGGELVLVPCLNDQAFWAKALAKLVDPQRVF